MSTNSIYENELMKRQYFQYLIDSKGFSASTIEEHEKAILLWQEHSADESFATFSRKKASSFRDWLKSKKKASDPENTVSLTYTYHMLRHLRVFFGWLSAQPGYKSKIIRSDVDYLRLSKKETRMATQQNKKVSPSIEEIKEVLESIVMDNEIAMRDYALISLVYLTGIRISAASSLPLGCFDEKRLVVDQNPKKGVKTKNSKLIATRFFTLPYMEPVENIVKWARYLKQKKGFTGQDPLFPATLSNLVKSKQTLYSAQVVGNQFWKSSASARKIFQKRFEDAGLPYYHPHSFRDTIVKEYTKTSLTEEEKKAVSQNLGHENVGTTFGSYGCGKIGEDRQFEIIESINAQKADSEFNQLKSEMSEMKEMMSKLVDEKK
jgi:integrase